MKIQLSRKKGSALIITLIITAVIGTALASYLRLASYQNQSVVHSQFWNGGIPIAEAGVEEALAHLNTVGDGNRATNGWILTNGQFYLKRSLDAGRYEVWITSDAQPEVSALGYVQEPLTGKEVKRNVRITTTKAGSYMKGIIARDNIVMNGGGVRIDSFDSTDPAYNTNGRYDAAKSKDGGFAGAVTGSINTGNGGIWGYAATGPNGSLVGNVGDFAWHAAGGGIQQGHYRKDLNISFPPVGIPFSTNFHHLFGPTNVTTTNFTYLTNLVVSTTYPSPEPVGGVTTSLSTVTTATKPLIWAGVMTTNTAATSGTTYPVAGTYVGNVVTRNVVEGKGKNAKTVTYYDYARITGYTYQTTTYSYNAVTTNASVSAETYAYASGSTNYFINSISMSGGSKYLVYGNTVLYAPNGVSLGV